VSLGDSTYIGPTADPIAAEGYAAGLEPEPRTRLRAIGDSLSARVGVARGTAPHARLVEAPARLLRDR